MGTGSRCSRVLGVFLGQTFLQSFDTCSMAEQHQLNLGRYGRADDEAEAQRKHPGRGAGSAREMLDNCEGYR